MTAPDLTAMLQDTLADEGWCCDPYGHEDGPPATGECSECDRLRGDTATALAATVRNWLGNEPANEAIAGVLLSNYASEYNADHLSSSDFTDEASAVLAALVQQIGDGQ